MGSNDFALLSLQLATMLVCAVVLGQMARRVGQPAMVGEIVGGLLVGVTVFGELLPDAHEWLFRSSDPAATSRAAIVKVGMLFFLFVAGTEIDISEVRRLGRRALAIGTAGTLVLLAGGVGLVFAMPVDAWGPSALEHRWALALFVGLNFANSANPVLARILMDLDLMKHEVGAVAMMATIVDDLVTWTVFAVILTSIDTPGTISRSTGGFADSALLGFVAVVGLFVVVVGGGRWIGRRTLSFVRTHTAWPTGFVGAVAVVVLLASAAAEAIGVHAFLGAFLVGVALTGHDADHPDAHDATARFALGFFAPIYFVSIAMDVDFVATVDVGLVLLLTVVACATKISGVLIGAGLARMPIDRDDLVGGVGPERARRDGPCARWHRLRRRGDRRAPVRGVGDHGRADHDPRRPDDEADDAGSLIVGSGLCCAR